MEPEQTSPATEQEDKFANLKIVTRLSKYLAMTLFVVLPFIGGWIGYQYAPEKVVELERVVEIETVAVNDIVSQTDPIENDIAEAEFVNGGTNEGVEGVYNDDLIITEDVEEVLSPPTEEINVTSEKPLVCNSLTELDGFDDVESVEKVLASVREDYVGYSDQEHCIVLLLEFGEDIPEIKNCVTEMSYDSESTKVPIECVLDLYNLNEPETVSNIMQYVSEMRSKAKKVASVNVLQGVRSGMVLCSYQKEIIGDPGDNAPMCSSTTWPDLSQYDAKWGGCDFFYDEENFQYCAILSDDSVYECTKSGCQ